MQVYNTRITHVKQLSLDFRIVHDGPLERRNADGTQIFSLYNSEEAQSLNELRAATTDPVFGKVDEMS